MKDMERWAKIQNRQKESIRSPSPLLKTGLDDDRRQSKSADAGFTIFERKVRNPPAATIHLFFHHGFSVLLFCRLLIIFGPILCLRPQISGGDDLFKKPLAPAKKDEKSKVSTNVQSTLHAS